MGGDYSFVLSYVQILCIIMKCHMFKIIFLFSLKRIYIEGFFN